MVTSAPSLEIPRYRLFCATWSTFSPESGLGELPQTAANASALRAAMSSIDALAGDPTLVHDIAGVDCITTLDRFLAPRDEDVVLYFASHGLVPSGASQFFRLATGDTQDAEDLARAFVIAEVIDKLTRSGTGRKLMIVDACYSGKAAASLLAAPNVDLDLPADICVLFATDPFTAAQAAPGVPLTAFTGALAELLTRGLPDHGPRLSVRSIFSELLSSADSQSIPRPWLVSTGTAAGAITFRNAASNGQTGAAYAERVEAFEHRAEILYVDDEAQPREDFRAELEHAGHRVTLAGDPVEGQQALEAGYFDLVVIDLLLRDDVPETEFIELCTQNAPDSLLFLVSRRTKSSRDNWELLETILPYPSRISAFLWKPLCVGAIAQHATRIRDARSATLAHMHGLEESVALVTERMIARNDSLGGQSERLGLEIRVCVERLVRRWFPAAGGGDSEHVYIESMAMRPVDGGRSASVVFILVPTLRGIDPESVTPLVLKLGPAQDIRAEVERYERFVEVGVPLDSRTDKIADASIGSVAGVIYSFRGAEDNSIRDVAELEPQKIELCLDVLFGKLSRKRWYASRGTGDGIAPLAHFARLGYSEKRFRDAYRQLEQSLEKTISELPPKDAARRERLDPIFEGLLRSHAATLVHGELTLDNILQINDSRFAIVDYRTVGLGPRLVDFATLEISCWMLARGAHMSRGERFLDARTAVPRTLREQDGGTVAQWLQPSRRLALKCRELAVENHGDATDREYGSLLWLAAVRLSDLRPRAISSGERNTHRSVLPAIALAAQVMVAAG